MNVRRFRRFLQDAMFSLRLLLSALIGWIVGPEPTDDPSALRPEDRPDPDEDGARQVASPPEPAGGDVAPPVTTTAIGAAFVASVVGSIAAAVVYWGGGQPQLEGLFLGVALGGIGFGAIWWAKRLMPVGGAEQPREPIASTPSMRAEATASFERRARPIERRTLLLRLLGAAIVGLGLAAVFPVRSLGQRPGGSLFHTDWGPGVRAVGEDGLPLRPADVPAGSITTVFPEGHVGSADGQALLIGLEASLYRPSAGREAWAPNGIVGFSKVCTHAGCPVGLYQPNTHELFCPCHQSVFAVLEDARPVSGPAARALPQLPLEIDDDGYVAASRDFSEPVGPGFWDLSHG
jgi:ubiquinol-cytochrome c reductase iron-sulfur subunit